MIARRFMQGFTLLEILLVMVILAIAASLIMPALVQPSGTQLRTAAGSVAAGLRQARNQAVDSHQDVHFTVYLQDKKFIIGKQARQHSLPSEVDVSVFTARSEVIDDRRAAIRFFPDGSSTGGRVTLSRDDKSYHVDVDWMTGQIRVRSKLDADSIGQGRNTNSVQLDS